MAASAVTSVPHWWNLPNQITASRLVLTAVVFVCFELQWYLAATILFVIAAATDWLDGYLARRYGQVTRLGRILDPFVDKLIVCGVFIYFGTLPKSGVPGWIPVLVMARELLVTALRGEVEGRGGDFSARWSGKWKMAAQCVAATIALISLTYWPGAEPVPDWMWWLRAAALAIAVVLTVHSGYVYVLDARRILTRPTA